MSVPTWATSLVHGTRAAPSALPRTHLEGDADALAFEQRARFTAAALRARRLYPGALGELVERELRSCADFGVEPAEDGLIARLAAQVLAAEGQR
jgi:hypothetical protein